MPEAAPAAAPVVAVPSKPVVEPKPQPGPEAPKPVEVKPVEPVKSDKPMGARYADLARREKGLALSRAELKAQQESVAAERAELKAWREEKARAKANPDAFARATWGDGYYEALTEVKLNGKPPADMALAAVDERIDALKAEQKAEREAAEKANQGAAAEREKVARAQFEGGAKAFLAANADAYKLTMRKGQANVTALIEANYKQTGQMLSYKDAADRVEEFYREEAKKDAAELGYQPAAPALVAKTLTNSMTGSAASGAGAPQSGDPFARALAIFKERQKR
jgi:hypothetical protein